VRRVTALVYAPDGAPSHVTLAAVNHGTSGIGQSCGPSHNASALGDLERMTLPIVSQGTRSWRPTTRAWAFAASRCRRTPWATPRRSPSSTACARSQPVHGRQVIRRVSGWCAFQHLESPYWYSVSDSSSLCASALGALAERSPALHAITESANTNHDAGAMSPPLAPSVPDARAPNRAIPGRARLRRPGRVVYSGPLPSQIPTDM
jgi:hypothetical protein